MKEQRIYDEHHRAYRPRPWPLVLSIGIAGGVLGWFAPAYLATLIGPFAAMGVTLAVVGVGAWGIVQLRYALWRHRHPWRPCDLCGPMLYLTFKTERQREVAKWQ